MTTFLDFDYSLEWRKHIVIKHYKIAIRQTYTYFHRFIMETTLYKNRIDKLSQHKISTSYILYSCMIHRNIHPLEFQKHSIPENENIFLLSIPIRNKMLLKYLKVILHYISFYVHVYVIKINKFLKLKGPSLWILQHIISCVLDTADKWQG